MLKGNLAEKNREIATLAARSEAQSRAAAKEPSAPPDTGEGPEWRCIRCDTLHPSDEMQCSVCGCERSSADATETPYPYENKGRVIVVNGAAEKKARLPTIGSILGPGVIGFILICIAIPLLPSSVGIVALVLSCLVFAGAIYNACQRASLKSKAAEADKIRQQFEKMCKIYLSKNSPASYVRSILVNTETTQRLLIYRQTAEGTEEKVKFNRESLEWELDGTTPGWRKMLSEELQ